LPPSLHTDDRTVPILAKSETVTGRLWTYAHDDPFWRPRAARGGLLRRTRPHRCPSEAHLASFASLTLAAAGFEDRSQLAARCIESVEAGIGVGLHEAGRLFDVAEVGQDLINRRWTPRR
jgi:transposase